MRLKSSRRALVAEAAHARLATPAQLQLLRAGSTARGAPGRRVLRARPTSDERTQRDGARTLRHESGRCRATPLSDLGSAQLRLLSCIAAFQLQLASPAPEHKPLDRLFQLHCSISIAACIPRAQTQTIRSVEKADGLCIAGNRLHCNGAAGTSPLQSTPWVHCRHPGCIATTQRT